MVNIQKQKENFLQKQDLQKSVVFAIFTFLFILDILYRLGFCGKGGFITISQEFLIALLCAFFSYIFKLR